MRRPFLPSLLAAAILLLSGCDVTEPRALSLRFTGLHTLNPDGSCDVSFQVLAVGLGAAEWEGARILTGETVLYQVGSANVAEFWGASRIQAGQRQVSTPQRVSGDATDVTVEVDFRVTESRTQSLPVVCEAASG